MKDTVLGHVQNDEGIVEGAIALHGQTLHSGTRVARKNETLFLLLNHLHFTPKHLRDDYVPHHFEVFQAGFVKRSLI